MENLEDTLSINHNWINGYNVHWGWALLRQQHAEVAESLAECADTCADVTEFEELVQRNLAANAGLDFRGYADFVGCIVRRELRGLQRPGLDRRQQLHHAFNLQRAAHVLHGVAEESGRAGARFTAAQAQCARSKRTGSLLYSMALNSGSGGPVAHHGAVSADDTTTSAAGGDSGERQPDRSQQTADEGPFCGSTENGGDASSRTPSQPAAAVACRLLGAIQAHLDRLTL